MRFSSAAMSAEPFIPKTRSLRTLRQAATQCQGCPLYQHATQTVFGAGSASARIVIVGEQPGNQEDQAGEPFVGLAGRLLHECLENAGISPGETYLTNAVKHFKFVPRGSKRLHKKPTAREVAACRPWLEHELHLIQPEVLICLGSTAAQSLLGSGIRVTRQHGAKLSTSWCANTMVTYHPSAALRAPSHNDRSHIKAVILHDLKIAARWLQ